MLKIHQSNKKHLLLFFIIYIPVLLLLVYLIFNKLDNRVKDVKPKDPSKLQMWLFDKKFSLQTYKNKQLFKFLQDRTDWYQMGTNEGWAGYDRVYFITLPERLANVRDAAEKLGVADSAWIFKAIHKDSLDYKKLQRLHILSPVALKHFPPMAYGNIGCHFSHLAVLKHCLQDPNVNTCVVFEDDLRLESADVTQRVQKFHDKIVAKNINWDFTYLDMCDGSVREYLGNDIVRLHDSYCLHAYVVKKHVIPSIIATVNPMQAAIDQKINNLFREGKLVAVSSRDEVFFSQNRDDFNSFSNPHWAFGSKELPRYSR